MNCRVILMRRRRSVAIISAVLLVVIILAAWLAPKNNNRGSAKSLAGAAVEENEDPFGTFPAPTSAPEIAIPQESSSSTTTTTQATSATSTSTTSTLDDSTTSISSTSSTTTSSIPPPDLSTTSTTTPVNTTTATTTTTTAATTTTTTTTDNTPKPLEADDFQPLSCNQVLSEDTICQPWSQAVTVNGGGLTTVPCGTCVVMDVGNLQLPGGLDIQGRLVIPDGLEFQLETTMIVVQGEWIMKSHTQITDTPNIRITLTGSTDRYFAPVGENARLCGEMGCNVGPQSITVAGGRVDCKFISTHA